MDPTRLMLVDDHEMIRTGLKTFLQSRAGFDVIAEASNGQEAIALALEMRPDIILMDVAMPIMSGIEAIRILKSQWHEAVVLALVEQEDKYYCLEFLAAGASGHITKYSTPDELIRAIDSVKEKQIYLQPALARWLLDDYRRLTEQLRTCPITSKNTAVGLQILSKRERIVLELVAEGQTSRQIGQRLRLSPKTIARHRDRIMSKLNMHSRTELLKFAIGTGLVSAR
ncbi:MAG: response regulator transcription factor [Chloroflexota bacterium]